MYRYTVCESCGISYRERGLDMTEAEIFLDAGQVAEMLRLSAATIRRWVLTGFIPCKKIGRAVRFSDAEIRDWAMSKSVGPVQPQVQPQAQENEGGGE